MKKGKWFLLFCVIGVGMASCSQQGTDTSNLYIPTPSDVTANANLDELNQGRALLIDNCGRCHGFYAPESFSSSNWRSVMSQMAPKTRMSSAEVALVTKYVTKGK
jgi:mono/diheme cytochrome c family protein